MLSLTLQHDAHFRHSGSHAVGVADRIFLYNSSHPFGIIVSGVNRWTQKFSHKLIHE